MSSTQQAHEISLASIQVMMYDELLHVMDMVISC